LLLIEETVPVTLFLNTLTVLFIDRDDTFEFRTRPRVVALRDIGQQPSLGAGVKVKMSAALLEEVCHLVENTQSFTEPPSLPVDVAEVNHGVFNNLLSRSISP